MEIIRYPERSRWPDILKRPVSRQENIRGHVQAILEQVKKEGDAALRSFSEKYDQVTIDTFKVAREEIDSAGQQINNTLKQAIDVATGNIKKFHAAQHTVMQPVETSPGVICWQKEVPIERVGLYIPGGSAPLFSTVLMLAIPARLAGCHKIILCSPPFNGSSIHPTILYGAKVTGITDIFKIGGAQAIAAMAYGTESIPAVDKIFGPGNPYVTEAKLQVSLDGVAIDLPAGPSEVAVLADQDADPEYVALDLISQAEHGPDSQVLLVTWSEKLIPLVQKEVTRIISDLPRGNVAGMALTHSKIILVKDRQTALDIINRYAPEHLIINTADAEQLSETIENAGSVFVGAMTPESAGDYASGTNHTLPTNGYARSYSGVSLSSFKKQITFQKISNRGLQTIGWAIETMAEAEQLEAHKRAVSVRLRKNQGVNNR